ncbi:hypothetical protein [Fodinicola acaciae]|uniref:hypothetical protein n=1 Tax=Fodinicola acaciae TaxID=2681555 RepID=UPI0013D09F3D|nr:hypothetical protein [Fodinicola acaciae]
MTTAQRMRESAVPDLYRRNAFRITGLATDATGRVVRERRQKLVTAAAFGGHTPTEWHLPETPDEAQIRAAFETIGDPALRIVDELLWFWGDDTACGCEPALHSAHDAAVRAHARALDAELSGDPSGPLWTEAARQWSDAFHRTGFWKHLRRRIETLDDPRLTEDAIQSMHAELPRTLIRPLVQLAIASPEPAKLLSRAAEWDIGNHTLRTIVEETVASDVDRITEHLQRAGNQLDAGKLVDAADSLKDVVLPALRQVERLAPHAEHRVVARVREKIAVLFNNCALAIAEKMPYGRGDLIQQLFATALELALEADTLETIQKNATMARTATARRAASTTGKAIGVIGTVIAIPAGIALVVALVMLAFGNHGGFDAVWGWACPAMIVAGALGWLAGKLEGLG